MKVPTSLGLVLNKVYMVEVIYEGLIGWVLICGNELETKKRLNLMIGGPHCI